MTVTEVPVRIGFVHPAIRAVGLDHVGQARRLATAAYLAASVSGDLGAAEAFLADSRRVCPGLKLPAETALATAFVLLHGDGDVAAARRILSPSAALGHLDRDIESLAHQAEPAEVLRIAGVAVLTDRLSDCRSALRRVARPEPGGGMGTSAMQAGIFLALEAYQTGQWDEAGQLAETVANRCARRGFSLLRRQAQTVLALVAVRRGEADTAQALADEIARWAAPRGIAPLLAAVHYVEAQMALARSDFAAAYDQVVKLSRPSRAPLAGWVLLDLVESALRTNRRDDAVLHLEAAPGATSPRMTLLVTAARAMIAPDDEAPALFDQALASETAQRWPFDRARVHLLAGERLRRMRALTAARVYLGAALDEFRRLGASAWAERAAAELRAAGQAPRGISRVGLQVLSPQELEIAQLAATGLSNKEIASRLFISHRTVASHLFRLFPKLGITSRAALGRALAASVLLRGESSC